QGDQRHIRPLARRRGARARRGHASRPAASVRHLLPVRRRRVRARVEQLSGRPGARAGAGDCRHDWRAVDRRRAGHHPSAARPGDAVVDAKGLVVSPGFIDIHNHSSGELAGDPAAESQVAQGITTVVLGPDGSSPWPIGEYLAERRQNPAAVNVAVMVGHATVRRLVMKDDYKRAARTDEVAQMAALVDRGMREGAVGLSSGLEYEVGSYSETAELVEMAKAAARHGGIYMSHIRDEADKAFDAFKEAIEIGERPHIPVQIAHLKPSN